MKNKYILIGLFCALNLQLPAQIKLSDIPPMPNPEARNDTMEREWAALQQSPPGLGVRDGFMFLLDALDTRYLTPLQVEWTLKLLQTRVITDQNAKSYGNIYWGWTETGGKVSFDQTNTFFARFEDVAIAIRVLWDNADKGVKMALYNDGFAYQPNRESFVMANSKGLRLTLQHPNNGKV